MMMHIVNASIEIVVDVSHALLRHLLNYQVCDQLVEDDDLSGSTGVIAVYDGLRDMLTVANVGDSMCVLSKGGKAVNMNRMHRLDDFEERARVEAAGGTIIKNR